MPYIHKGCGGIVPFNIFTIFTFRHPKCKKCGLTWPYSVIWTYPPPKNMQFVFTPPVISKGTTKYAGWADRVPGAGLVASRLPKWPRWARVLTVCLIIVGVVFLVRHIVG